MAPSAVGMWKSAPPLVACICSAVNNHYVQQYVSPAASSFPNELKDPAGMWVSDRVNPQSLVVNTDLVKADELPMTWTDMVDPRWKGRLAIDDTNVLLYVAMKD